jgi:hypothetical protein
MAPELDCLGRLERLGDHCLCIRSNDSGFQGARHFERYLAHACSPFALVPILFVRLLCNNYRVQRILRILEGELEHCGLFRQLYQCVGYTSV